MIILLSVGIAVAVLGALVAALAVAVACMQDKGRRCAYRRPSAAAILAADLIHWARPQRLAVAALAAVDGWLRGGEFLLPPAPYLEPIVTDAEVREEDERLAAERPGEIPMSPDPAVTPFTGWRVPDGHQLPAGRGLMFTRTPYPTAADPVTPAATDDDPPWDIETAQQPALDDERRYALALGPDGCEEVR